MPAPEPGPKDDISFWKRLPRQVYWTVGAAVAFSGALIARSASDEMPMEDRFPYWMAGSAVVFFGLFILSLGTRSRLGNRRDR